MIRIGSIEAFADIAATTGAPAKSRTDGKRAVKGDSVDVSTEAQQALQVFKMAADDGKSEVRQEVVEAARKRIEEGTYRMQSVVTLVASRLTRYV